MIKNLSEKRRLPRLGKISLGVKKLHPQSGKEYPTEVDYFVVPEKVAKVFGEKPKELKIMFPVENPEVFFQQWYKCYGYNLLKCKGDGEKALCWDEEKGGLKEIPCPCEKLENRECSRIGILQFLLPDVEGAGVWQITTGSRNSIIDINSGIDYIKALCGRIRMIPLILKREEIATQRVEGGKLKKGKHYTLKLDLDNVSLRQIQLAAQIEPEKVFLPPPDESKDDLFFPKEGFAPEEEEEKEAQRVEKNSGDERGFFLAEEEEEKEEENETDQPSLDVALDVAKAQLVGNVAKFENAGGKLTPAMKARLNKLIISGSLEEICGARDYFKNKLNG